MFTRRGGIRKGLRHGTAGGDSCAAPPLPLSKQLLHPAPSQTRPSKHTITPQDSPQPPGTPAHLCALVAVQAVDLLPQRLGTHLGLPHQHQGQGNQRALLHKVDAVPAGQGRT